jgi:hypothetical protein
MISTASRFFQWWVTWPYIYISADSLAFFIAVCELCPVSPSIIWIFSGITNFNSVARGCSQSVRPYWAAAWCVLACYARNLRRAASRGGRGSHVRRPGIEHTLFCLKTELRPSSETYVLHIDIEGQYPDKSVTSQTCIYFACTIVRVQVII